jgi:hypothetical protein
MATFDRSLNAPFHRLAGELPTAIYFAVPNLAIVRWE